MIKDDCGGVWLEWPHVITLFDDNRNERDYIPERTCRRMRHEIANGWIMHCSECGNILPLDGNYCHNCGAKVLRNVTVSQAAPFSDVADSESARFSSFENLQQSASEPIENLHTAKIEMCHGDHPPYPLFEGDAWTAWFVCSECTGAVDFYDEYCKHCGAKLEPYDRLESGE